MPQAPPTVGVLWSGWVPRFFKHLSVFLLNGSHDPIHQPDVSLGETRALTSAGPTFPGMLGLQKIFWVFACRRTLHRDESGSVVEKLASTTRGHSWPLPLVGHNRHLPWHRGVP